MANPSNTVHIASVPSIVTKGEIELIFEPYGNIVRIQIVGRLARIFCFVEYDSTGAATRAIEALNGKSVFSEEVFGDASPLVLDFSKGKRIADRGWNPEGRKSVETRDDEEEDVEEVSVSLVTGTDGTQLMKVKEEEEEIDEHW
jgi:RNA recognition motif-containing protein